MIRRILGFVIWSYVVLASLAGVGNLILGHWTQGLQLIGMAGINGLLWSETPKDDL